METDVEKKMKPATKPRQQGRSRTRMSPQMRREMILEAAVAHFADHGFEVQIRQLAREIGISPALVFKYFDGKDALIDAVYDTVFEARWDEAWDRAIKDRSRPLPERLSEFYLSYLAVVDDRNWIRIAMRASLDGNDMTRRYIDYHVSTILGLIADEIDHSRGPDAEPADQDRRIERVWHLHSTVIYYLIRKHIHQTPVMPDREAFVDEVIGQFLGQMSQPG